EIERIGLEYLRPDATLQIVRATLWDSVTKTACPIDDLQLPPERWRRLNQFGEIEVWENLKLRPRAWFVPRVQVTPGDEVLRIIKEGKFGDGKPFDPVAVAFIDTEEADRWRKDQTPAPEAGGVPADAQVGVTSYQPQRIELKSRNSQPGFLVLSEVYDRGWRAKIDGHETPVFRTDYTLRGVAVPPGEHRIEVTYCPRSFRLGATGSGIGTLLLLVYFLPAVRGRVLLAIADSWTYSLPMRMLLGRMIASGTLPLWNPYTYAGMPLLAAVQPGVLYPPNWLFAVLPPGVAMNAVTILTYHVALVGTYLYARALT